MPNLKMPKLKLWSPRDPALAVRVRGNVEISWEQYLNLMSTFLEELAKGEKEPQAVLEREWFDQVGNFPSLTEKGVASLPESAEFQELLAERHNLRARDFPMQVKPPYEEDLDGDLMEWVREVKWVREVR
jgi:hypothetical protein